jgi:hypothetical protein
MKPHRFALYACIAAVLVGATLTPPAQAISPTSRAVDITECNGHKKIRVPHEVQVVGASLGLKSGFAWDDTFNDRGVFLWEKSDSGWHYYDMTGWSERAECLGSKAQELLESVSCHHQTPVAKWIEWASRVDERLADLQGSVNPLPSCET